MNYQKIYDSIIYRSQYRDKKVLESEYTEEHHIIPRSLGGVDAKANICTLTLREHFLVHWLLVKIHKNKDAHHKMIYAFNMMCCRIDNKGYINSHKYHYARKHFMEYMRAHKWDNPEWKQSHSVIMKQYYINNPVKKRVINMEERTCICGCLETFTCDVIHNKRFIHGHNTNIEDTERNIKISKAHKEQLSKMTKEELSLRSTHSLGSCDHIARGIAISKTKKGIPSFQGEIVGARLYVMSDCELDKYLKEKSPTIIKRFNTFRRNAGVLWESLTEVEMCDKIKESGSIQAALEKYLIDGKINGINSK